MSTVNTAMLPSHARAGGGADRGFDRGKRGRDWQSGRDRRDSRVLQKSKPVDRIQAKHFHIDGAMRQAALGLARAANTGKPCKLLDDDGRELELVDRAAKVRSWLQGLNDGLNVYIEGVSLAQHGFSHLSEAFAHVVRAISDAGYFDQLVAMLVNDLTEQAVRDFDKAESVQYADE